MKNSAITQLIGFIVLAVAVVAFFRWVFPQNHAYGSIAQAAYAAIFGCVARLSALRIVFFGIVYSIFLIADSQLGVGLLTSVKTSESLVFPMIAGAILTAFMFVGFGLRAFVERHGASSNH